MKEDTYPISGQSRVIIKDVYPSIEGGCFPIKRVIGQEVTIWADLVADGHDVIRGRVAYKHADDNDWHYSQFQPEGNDRFRATFLVDRVGRYEYRLEAWIDHALSWLTGTRKKLGAGQDISVELKDGVAFLDELTGRLKGLDKTSCKDRKNLFSSFAEGIKSNEDPLDTRLEQWMYDHPSMLFMTVYPVDFQIIVDPKKALFSTWYEFFPRSASPDPDRHGNFRDVLPLLERVADLGFDTLYFPPVHPIGRINRKGKNNTLTAGPDDVGSAWGIGSEDGGHFSIHPELGTIDDFRAVIVKARELGIDIAMDIAFQAAPDHPWVKEHPQWFKWRSDGTVQYAENPPKKYQDILPIHFETDDWKALWDELLRVFLFWIEQGVRVFRVDNPHTKPFPFWDWVIGRIKEKYPEVIFLSEAFSRPAVMHRLAMGGFTQSYSYFTWRVNKHEIIEYMEELTRGPGAEYFRPNFWPNTPDILPWHLQSGLEPVFLHRLFLAATLSSNYGVYGPAYELLVHEALPGKEEYADSEKFQRYVWDWDRKSKVSYLMQQVNRHRKEHPALQQTNRLSFCSIENEHLLGYVKTAEDGSDPMLMVVNLDPYNRQSGMIRLDRKAIGRGEGDALTVTDLLTGNSYYWNLECNYVELDPAWPFHLFVIS